MLLSAEHITKIYGTRAVLDGASLYLERGQKLGVIGVNGSGKSTFLRCLNRLEEITGGEVVVDGHDLTDKKTDLNKVRENVGMVFQHFNLFNNLNVMGNMMLAPVELKKASKAEAKERALHLLDRVGLAEKAEAYPAQLSGGDGDTVIRAAGELLGVQFSDIELQDVYPAKVALYVDQSLLSEERLALIDQIAVALKRILTAGVGLRLYLRTYRTYRYDLNIGHGAMVNVVRWLPPVSQDRSSRADFKIGHGGFTEADFYPPIVGKDRLFESRFETSRGTYLPPVIEGVYPDTVQTATMAHEGVRGAVYHTHLKPRRID